MCNKKQNVNAIGDVQRRYDRERLPGFIQVDLKLVWEAEQDI